MVAPELLLLVEVEPLKNLTVAVCTVCLGNATWEGTDARLPAVQHVRTTGHPVRVTRDYVEELRPHGKQEAG